jgi:prepilin-type N-terminal cleavage/methylation domain-containing protein
LSNKKEHGFTIIELLFVIGIIGILTTIAMPSYQRFIYRAEVTEVILLMDKIQTVLSELQSELPGSIGSDYTILPMPPTDPSDPALQYYAKPSGARYPITGLTMDEIVLNLRAKFGFQLILTSGISRRTVSPGRYKISIAYGSNADPETRQYALAIFDIMAPQAEYSSKGRTAISLTFKL